MTVELFDPNKKYDAPAGAGLVDNGGPYLQSVELIGVFCDGFPLSQEMSAFLDFLATSDVLQNLSEYNVGTGAHISDSTLAPGFSGTVQDSDLQYMLVSAIQNGQVPMYDANTLYVIYLPSGVTVDMDAQNASCTQFCGYHSALSMPDGTQTFYAVLPYPDCDGCLGGLSPQDALTSVTTHEVCEAVTDPVPGNGWYDQANGEIGDICAWQQRQDGGFTVQLEWSNAQNSCI